MSDTAHPARTQVIDVREIQRPARHNLIFEAYEKLPVGETIELVNDHDHVAYSISSNANSPDPSPGKHWPRRTTNTAY